MRFPIVAAMLLALAGCSTGSTTAVPWPVPDTKADTTTASGLKYSILDKAPAGAAVAKAGQVVTVNYAGWLTDGTLFDASFNHGNTFSFTLGAGGVIKGWDEGVAGMGVGERRKLVIPANLGYGAAGTNGIPGNSTLLFDVQLVSIKG